MEAAMAKFLPGNPGKPKGAKNKKKALKIEDFVAQEGINVGKAWWDTIQAITNATDRANAMAQYYKYVGAPPKPTEETQEPEVSEAADILSIIK